MNRRKFLRTVGGAAAAVAAAPVVAKATAQDEFMRSSTFTPTWTGGETGARSWAFPRGGLTPGQQFIYGGAAGGGKSQMFEKLGYYPALGAKIYAADVVIGLYAGNGLIALNGLGKVRALVRPQWMVRRVDGRWYIGTE